MIEAECQHAVERVYCLRRRLNFLYESCLRNFVFYLLLTIYFSIFKFELASIEQFTSDFNQMDGNNQRNSDV